MGFGLKISLIMCSIERTKEPDRLISSLVDQTYMNFELIVVDQNTDNRLESIVDKYRNKFAIRLLRSKPGLSRARNVALSHIKGDIIGFPDDDCWYPATLLEGVARHFESFKECKGLSVGRADNQNSNVIGGRAKKLNRYNLWGHVSSYRLFISRSIIDLVGGFDETLGVGAGTLWGSGEDTDYVLRSMSICGNWIYDPSLRVFHAPSVHEAIVDDRLRARAYARGLGRVLRKNKLPVWMVFGGCCLSFCRICGAIVCGNISRARWHMESLIGRIAGWAADPKDTGYRVESKKETIKE